MSQFVHLHVHTQYSILDGACKINELIKRAKELNMPAIAITDHGNMYGVMEFVTKAYEAGIKPIIGVETYVARNKVANKSTKEDRSGYHLVFLAKNMVGYKNLIKLVSRSFLEGFYYTPRIDKQWLKEYKEGLIALSGCLGGEIPQLILNNQIEKAEMALKSYLEIFKDNFYIEIQNLGYTSQEFVNSELKKLSDKYNVKLVASNDVHFINKEDFEIHKLLIAINTGAEIKDEMSELSHSKLLTHQESLKKEATDDMLSYTGNEFLRSYEEMLELFSNQKEVLDTSITIAEQIEEINLKRKVVIPTYPLPSGYHDDNEYLRFLCFEGAKKIYGTINDEVKTRLEYELEIIKKMNLAGYLLIVHDIISAARKLGVIVGPGRGSIVGSLVAYTLGITKIDSIKYKLLFERFLNPERISLPDIDTDFDNEGREQVLKYVIEKYGKEKVAQIVTFGTLGAKTAIRDVARVFGVDIAIADKLAKMIPDTPGISIKNAIKTNSELENILKEGSEVEKKILLSAEKLEGMIRQTGVHACGIIIGNENLTEYIPLALAKDTLIPITQYEGSYVEEAGMLKIDLLGLETLSIIKDCLQNIKQRYNKTIDIDEIPLDDKKTLELFQQGETIGVFQFESDGMRKWLKELKPTSIEDLIAMNSLYRPGPMKNIENYINRKHNKEEIKYPHPLLEEVLKDTYGIMVYQEQIILAAQVLAGYTAGQADILRAAMGKKKTKEMAKQKEIFVKKAMEKTGITEEQALNIFEQIQEFAGYGFNRSHSTAYTVLAFQTAYLKAHYPAEYMAALLTHHLSDIKKINFYIEECRRMNIKVLGPDINESFSNFMVDTNGNIRFGLSALKNVGEVAANFIIEDRIKNGKYINFQNFLKRINLKAVNKKCIESLAYAGAFDSFGIRRAQFFYKEKDVPFIEHIMKHASLLQSLNTSHQSLFNDALEDTLLPLKFPQCQEFSPLELYKHEKEVTGFYLTSHPLHLYKNELKFCNAITIEQLKNIIANSKEGKTVCVAGIIKDVKEKLTKNNKKYVIFTLEDESDSFSFSVFEEDYQRLKHYIVNDNLVVIKAIFQKRKTSTEIFDLRIEQIQLLSEIEKKIKSIEIFLPLSQLENLYMDIIENIKNNPGDKIVRFVFFDDIGDKDEAIKFSAIMDYFKVNLNFLKFLEQNEIKYKLC